MNTKITKQEEMKKLSNNIIEQSQRTIINQKVMMKVNKNSSVNFEEPSLYYSENTSEDDNKTEVAPKAATFRKKLFRHSKIKKNKY